MTYDSVLVAARKRFNHYCEASDLIRDFLEGTDDMLPIDADKLFRILMLDESWDVLEAGQVYHAAMEAIS